jgi:hypothetical protein
VMPVLLAERSSSIHTVDGVLTVVVLSPERISLRSIDLPPTLADGLQNLWSTPSFADVLSSNSHTPSVSPSHSPSSSTATVPLPEPLMSLLRSSETTSISDQVLLSRSSTWPSQSTSRPPRMVTSPTKTSHGRSPRSLSSK